MKKVIILLSLLLLSGCANSSDNQTNSNNQDEMKMKLYIDEKLIEEVGWENNDSTKALEELSKNKLSINMTNYGGFEQTGLIGQDIARNDSQIKTNPGDIVLYNGNQISVFYKTNQWSYTKLGHINLDDEKLKDLLDKSSIVFTLEHN